MELVSLLTRRRNLDVLFVEDEQRAMKLGSRPVIDPRRGVPVGGSVGGIRGVAEVARDVHQLLFESDISIKLGVEVRRFEQGRKPVREGLIRAGMTTVASDQGNGRQLDGLQRRFRDHMECGS